MTKFKLTPEQGGEAWCGYRIVDPADNTVQYIGVTKLASVLSMADLRSNPTVNIRKEYELEILGVYKNHSDAANNTYDYEHKLPPMNLSNHALRRTGVIRCDQTGQIFYTQNEVSRVMGINQSQLSQHLRRNPRYKSVKGFTFSKIYNQDALTHPTQYPSKKNPAATTTDAFPQMNSMKMEPIPATPVQFYNGFTNNAT